MGFKVIEETTIHVRFPNNSTAINIRSIVFPQAMANNLKFLNCVLVMWKCNLVDSGRDPNDIELGLKNDTPNRTPPIYVSSGVTCSLLFGYYIEPVANIYFTSYLHCYPRDPMEGWKYNNNAVNVVCFGDGVVEGDITAYFLVPHDVDF